ncbi:MAG: hypothetical protein IJI36_18060 [Kiritimatiellae bacterium]|nr:hypothetical protein [Kiritimatiellia bacterium]
MKGHALTTQPPNHQTKANTERGKNGIIHAMKPHAKTALSLALVIVGGIAADPFDAGKRSLLALRKETK